jgi:hypothetical protein
MEKNKNENKTKQNKTKQNKDREMKNILPNGEKKEMTEHTSISIESSWVNNTSMYEDYENKTCIAH